MVNILLEGNRIGDKWLYDELKNYIKPNHKVVVIAFSFRDSLIKNNDDWSTLYSKENGQHYKGIIDSLHITQDELAEKIGKSRSSITNTLGLLNLPSAVQNMVLDGKLSMGHARELSKLDDREKVIEYAKKIVNDNLSVREIEALSRGQGDKKRNPINRGSKESEYV